MNANMHFYDAKNGEEICAKVYNFSRLYYPIKVAKIKEDKSYEELFYKFSQLFWSSFSPVYIYRQNRHWQTCAFYDGKNRENICEKFTPFQGFMAFQ